MASKGLIFNQDSDNFLFTRQGRLELLTEQYLKDFIYQYRNTSIYGNADFTIDYADITIEVV